MQPLHLRPAAEPEIYYTLKGMQQALPLEEEEKIDNNMSQNSEFYQLDSNAQMIPLEPLRTPARIREKNENQEENSNQEEEDTAQHYAWDLTQHHISQSCTREKTPLDSIIPNIPPIPDQILEQLTVKFVPCEFCPTPYLKDLNPKATIRSAKYLAHKYPHEADKRIVFVEEPHRYFIDGCCENIMSATTMIKCFFPEFDAKAQSMQTFNSKTFGETNHRQTSDYYGCKSPEDIQKRWSSWADQGTMLHANIENYLNHEPFEIIEENIEPFQQFKKIMQNDRFVNWTPYRTEMSIFDPETRVAGQIDFVGMIDPESRHVVLIDWKRCKSIGDCCFNRFKGLPPTMGLGVCSHIENSKFATYSLQLNLYKYILEKNYGLYVKKMLIIQMHPKLKKYGATVYKIGNFQKVIEQIMACRKIAIAKFGENTMKLHNQQ